MSSSVPSSAEDADLGDAVGEAQRRLHRLGQALADVVAPHQPVDDHLDGVLLVAGQVERGALGQLDHLPVDAGPGEALLGQVVEERLVLTLAPRTTGASTWKRVPSGRSRMRSTICWGVWRATGRPQFGQWGWPTRA